MSMKRTWAISSAISCFTSAAICLHEQCANPCLTSSWERRNGVMSDEGRAALVDPVANPLYLLSLVTMSLVTLLVLRRERGDEFLEAGVATQRIPIGSQLQRAIANRAVRFCLQRSGQLLTGKVFSPTQAAVIAKYSIMCGPL